eukprot:11973-Heterococcus_DN1.PRE.2
MSVSGSHNCMSKSDVSYLSGEFVLLKNAPPAAGQKFVFASASALTIYAMHIVGSHSKHHRTSRRCYQYAVHMIERPMHENSLGAAATAGNLLFRA